VYYRVKHKTPFDKKNRRDIDSICSEYPCNAVFKIKRIFTMPGILYGAVAFFMATLWVSGHDVFHFLLSLCAFSLCGVLVRSEYIKYKYSLIIVTDSSLFLRCESTEYALVKLKSSDIVDCVVSQAWQRSSFYVYLLMTKYRIFQIDYAIAKRYDLFAALSKLMGRQIGPDQAYEKTMLRALLKVALVGLAVLVGIITLIAVLAK